MLQRVDFGGTLRRTNVVSLPRKVGSSCRPKIHGGLGFSTAKKFNEELLAKLTRLVASKRVSPCIAAFRSKYKVKDESRSL